MSVGSVANGCLERVSKMSSFGPQQLTTLIENLSIKDAHGLWAKIGRDSSLTPEHASALLQLAPGLSEWHKIMAVLMIGDLFFDNEFVDYAIDMLTFPASGEDPSAVIMHATNLLVTRKTIYSDQYRRISDLPQNTPGKQRLLDTLRCRLV